MDKVQKYTTVKETQRTRKILIGLNYWVIKAEQAWLSTQV